MASEHKTVNGLTKNEVLQLFAQRAGGATMVELGKAFNISPSTASAVLRRRHHKQVPIPPMILQQVQAKYRKRPSGGHAPPGAGTLALAEYAAAVKASQDWKDKCLAAGYSQDLLELMADAITQKGG